MKAVTTEALGHEEHYFLSEDDVDRLMHDDSPESRIDVMQKISRQYIGKSYTEAEMLYAEQIFRLLLRDSEVKVRRALAENLRDVSDIPRDIILELTQDRQEVAIPVISSSTVLSDADLIRIIENSREVEKIEAVARRDEVSERVSSALIDTHYPSVVQALLENEQARIAAPDYETILKDHSHNSKVMESMALRSQLPLPIVEKLISHVSDALVSSLQEKYQVDLSEAKRKTREAMTLQILPHSSSDEEIEAMVQQMISFNRLSPSVILSSLCQGHLRFFEIALARLANIPKANARRLIRDKGLLGFEALYEKTHMPESTYDAVRLLLTVVLELEKTPEAKPGTALFANLVIDHLLAKSNNQEIENLSYIIALVRQSIVH